MTRIFLLSLAILCSTFMKAQNDEHHVMMQYPEVYQSINAYVDQNVRGQMNAQAKQEQYTAFLDLAESTEQVQDEAMTNAILKWSLKSETAYNRNIIDDQSIENPFPFLRCNWYAVRAEYGKAINPTAVARPSQMKAVPLTPAVRQQQNYGSIRQPIPATSLKEYSNQGQRNTYNQGQQQNYGSKRQPIPATSLQEYSNYGQQNYNYNNNQKQNYSAKPKAKDKNNFRQYYSDQYKQVYSDQYKKEMEVLNGSAINEIGNGYYYENNVTSYPSNYPDPYEVAQPATEVAPVYYPGEEIYRSESTTRYQNKRSTLPQQQVTPQEPNQSDEVAPVFYRKGR